MKSHSLSGAVTAPVAKEKILFKKRLYGNFFVISGSVDGVQLIVDIANLTCVK